MRHNSKGNDNAQDEKSLSYSRHVQKQVKTN